MKILRFLMVPIAALIAMSSCSKHEIENYSGVDAIFFDQQHLGAAHESWIILKRLTHKNYTLVNFNTILESYSLLRIKIETTGYLKDYERPFRIEVVADSTDAIEGEEFELINPNLSILPGENTTFMEVKVHKTERMLEQGYRVQFRLMPGEHFTLPFGQKGIGNMPLRDSGDNDPEYGKNSDPSVHNLYITAELTQPGQWPSVPGHIHYLGTFSKKKYKLILELCKPYGWGILEWENPQKMPMDRLNIIKQTTASYLVKQYELGREHWVIDEDGSMMWVKTCPWSDGARPEDLVDKN